MPNIESLLITDLLRAYRAGGVTPREVLTALLDRIDAAPERYVWITRLARAQVLDYVARLESRRPDELPLYGIPFAIKDNIDLAGVPTTAACPDFAYTPENSAPVVQKLMDAGAIPLGKTNLDQFATGLVGVRSPYGACRNSFNPEFISGGSSSGSAVAVATGLVSFALGTDTAGSGRVPAAFNNIVGLKPSCGLLSSRGMVPACRTLDCISIFALTAGDAAVVAETAAGFDPQDPYARVAHAPHARFTPQSLRVGVPRADQLEFFGDADYARLFAAATQQIQTIGGRLVEIDFAPFLETARLLYEGPWVAERYAAVEAFIEARPQALHPVTRSITLGGKQRSAVEVFKAQYRLQTLKRASEAAFRNIDVMLTPTAGTIYRIAEVEADPVRLNSNLGYYTNFMNLLDLAAVAVPAGWRRDGLPFGITLFAARDSDADLLQLAARFQQESGLVLGATQLTVPKMQAAAVETPRGYFLIAVCGAHMSGLPLNHQLTSRGGIMLKTARTTERYKLYALPGGPPQRPGLVRMAEQGSAIDVEVWALPLPAVGAFVAEIPAPLCIGSVELEDGSTVAGFVCEGYVVQQARDVSEFGGWRAYLASSS